MSIVDWPAEERPREKLLLRGPGALSDAELLAIFLRTGVTGKTAVDMARELLVRFGSLRALLAAERDDFCAAPGLGAAKYAQLQAVLEVGRRQLGEGLQRGAVLSSPKDTEMYLHARLGDRQQEVFCCLFLDNRHRVLAFEELFYGTINVRWSIHAKWSEGRFSTMPRPLFLRIIIRPVPPSQARPMRR